MVCKFVERNGGRLSYVEVRRKGSEPPAGRGVAEGEGIATSEWLRFRDPKWLNFGWRSTLTHNLRKLHLATLASGGEEGSGVPTERSETPQSDRGGAPTRSSGAVPQGPSARFPTYVLRGCTIEGLEPNSALPLEHPLSSFTVFEQSTYTSDRNRSWITLLLAATAAVGSIIAAVASLHGWVLL